MKSGRHVERQAHFGAHESARFVATSLALMLVGGCFGEPPAINDGSSDTAGSTGGTDAATTTAPGTSSNVDSTAGASSGGSSVDVSDTGSDATTHGDTGTDGSSSGTTGPSLPCRTVFVTSVQFNGDSSTWGGGMPCDSFDGPHAIAACRCDVLWSLSNSGSPLTFQAWLSTSSVSAAEQVEPETDPDRPYCLVDGTVVANGWSQLIGETPLDHSIDMTEQGGVLDEPVWTGTNPDGTTITDAHCNNWTDEATLMGGRGLTKQTGDGWTADSIASADGVCSGQVRLYCFEK